MNSPSTFKKNALKKLSLSEKRQLMVAMLRKKISEPRSFPLSLAQEQLWFMEQLQPGTPTYNIPLYIPFHESVDLAILHQTLQFLAQRHDMLRAHFSVLDEQLVQIIEPMIDVHVEEEDLSRLLPEQKNTSLNQLLNEEVQKPFDLKKGCIRYKCIKIDAFNSLLCITMHHIIADGWSLGVYSAEFNKLYQAYSTNRQAQALPPLSIEYMDYAQWQREHLQGMRLHRLIQYWTQQLEGVPRILQLPTDFERPNDQTFNGTVASFAFNEELSRALVAFANQHNVTPYMLLLACYYTLLYRYTGQEDIVVGAPVANRSLPEFEPLIGLFVNALILRIKIAEQTTFHDLLQQVRKISLEAFEHQALPFEKLINEMNIERVPGYSPLYQVVFNFQNPSLIETSNTYSTATASSEDGFDLVHSNTSKVDLNLAVGQKDGNIFGGMEYNTDLFEEGTINHMLYHFEMIAKYIVEKPSLLLLDIPLESTAKVDAKQDDAHQNVVQEKVIDSQEVKDIEEAFSFE